MPHNNRELVKKKFLAALIAEQTKYNEHVIKGRGSDLINLINDDESVDSQNKTDTLKAAIKTKAKEQAAARKAEEKAEKAIAKEQAAAEKVQKRAEEKEAKERADAEKAQKIAEEKEAKERAAAEKAQKRAEEKEAKKQAVAAKKTKEKAQKKALGQMAKKQADKDSANTAAVDENLRIRALKNNEKTPASEERFRSNFHNAFPEWTTSMLGKVKFDNNKIQLHQAIPSKYINTKTPFRGLLLYHGLGSGKTRTAISIAETGGFKNVIVILPAALKTNFETELKKFTEVSNNKYEFIHSNGLTSQRVKSFEEDHFDNKLIIIDEVHNITSGIKNHDSTKKKLYEKLIKAKNSRFVLMSGTPMINHPVEISHIVNLLRGEQLVYFTTVSGDPTKLSNFLVSNQYVLNSKITLTESRSQYKVEFTLTPPMFITSEKGLLMKIKKGISDKTKVKSIAEHLKIELKNINKKNNFALPFESSDFDEQFKDIKSNDVFKRRIAGSVSYYAQQEENSKRFAKTEHIDVPLPMTDHQFEQYKVKRAEEMKSEGTRDSNSVYKVYSRAVSNFTFPAGPDLERKFPKDLRMYVNNTLDQDSADLVSTDPIFTSKKKGNDKDYTDEISKLIKNLSQYFDELATNGTLIETLETVLSPKFADIYKKIEEEKGICMVYSDFKNVEGIQIMKLILEKQGICELNIEKKGNAYVFKPKRGCKRYFIHYGSSSDPELNKILLQISNNDFEDLEKNHKALFEGMKEEFNDIEKNIQVNGDIVKCVLLTKSGSEGISLRNIRSVFIVEPYWNNIRLKQVIGRAVRMDSHKALASKERTVKIYSYRSIFSEAQKKEVIADKKLRKDQGLTSDQMIQKVAQNKADKIKRFETLLQEASIDCTIHNKSKDRCLAKNPAKKDYDNMFAFDIKRDAFTISKPARRTNGESDEGVVLIKFSQPDQNGSNKDHEYLYAPTNSSVGNLYDVKNGNFAGVMKKISKTKYKISIKN